MKRERPFPHLYNTQRWRRRSALHRRTHPLCVPCAAAGKTVVAVECHHIIPHNGDPGLFFLGPIEGLCHDCHQRAHGRNPSSGYSREIAVDGWPIDPSHVVYKHEGKQR